MLPIVVVSSRSFQVPHPGVVQREKRQVIQPAFVLVDAPGVRADDQGPVNFGLPGTVHERRLRERCGHEEGRDS